MKSFKPDSSFVKEVEYVPGIAHEGTLKVTLASGTYYYKAPVAEFDNWALATINDQSAGEYYNQNIKGVYPSRKEGEDWPEAVSVVPVTFQIAYDYNLEREDALNALKRAMAFTAIPGFKISVVSFDGEQTT